MKRTRRLFLFVGLVVLSLLTACGSGAGDKAFEGVDYQKGAHVFFVFTSPT